MIMFRNRLQKVYRHLGKQAKRLGVSCWRVYDHDLPEFPFCIEIYSDKIYVAEYKRRHGMTEEEHENWLVQSLEVIAHAIGQPMEHIYLRLRQRKAGRLGQYQRHDVAKNEFIVGENELQFIVNLSDYLDTGLFLDHRVTRQMLREGSKDRSILNLFAYTGSFSVYAASGGAKEVITVDLSKTYLAWAQRNMQLNGFVDESRYKYEHADVRQYLKTLTPDHFDLVILDPPTFSNSQRMEDILDVQRDHVELINDCLIGMRAGGTLYFSTNFTRFQLEARSINSGNIRDITKQTTPFDFEGKLRRYCFKIIKYSP